MNYVYTAIPILKLRLAVKYILDAEVVSNKKLAKLMKVGIYLAPEYRRGAMEYISRYLPDRLATARKKCSIIKRNDYNKEVTGTRKHTKRILL